MGFAFFQRVDRRFADVPRRVEIRLADAERDDVLHLGDDLEKVADAGLGQVDDVPGDVACGVHCEFNWKWKTSNIEHRTSNWHSSYVHWMFDVGCWLLDVPL